MDRKVFGIADVRLLDFDYNKLKNAGLIVKPCPQARCKLFQQVTSLQMTSCNKADFNTLVAT